MKPASHSDLHDFCRIDGWEDADKRAGRAEGDHTRYMRVLANGDVLRTKVSHGTGEISGDLLARIFRDQLRVTPEQFWQALRTRTPVERPEDTPPPPTTSLPLWLVRRLRDKIGIPESQILTMDEAAARARYDLWCARPDR